MTKRSEAVLWSFSVPAPDLLCIIGAEPHRFLAQLASGSLQPMGELTEGYRAGEKVCQWPISDLGNLV